MNSRQISESEGQCIFFDHSMNRLPVLGLFLSTLCFLGTVSLELTCGNDHNCGMLPDNSDPAVNHLMKCGNVSLSVANNHTTIEVYRSACDDRLATSYMIF